MDRFIEHHGCRLAYTVRGDGPAVLFIQGVGVQGQAWKPQIDALADRFTCISFDNRGIGQSMPFAPPLTVDQLAEDGWAILTAAGFDAAHLVGHSLGGLIALQMALKQRQRVKSLSLLCTFADGAAAAPLTLRMMWAGMRSRIGTRAMRRNGFLRIVTPPPYPRGDDARKLAEQMAELFGHDLGDQPAIVSSQLKAMRSSTASARLGELAGVPTLVVGAAHDPIAPPHVVRAIAEGIPGAQLVSFDDASHGLPITHAARLNELLAAHLQRTP